MTKEKQSKQRCLSPSAAVNCRQQLYNATKKQNKAITFSGFVLKVFFICIRKGHNHVVAKNTTF